VSPTARPTPIKGEPTTGSPDSLGVDAHPVSRSFAFEAATTCRGTPVSAQRLHGHHYRLEITVEGPVNEHASSWTSTTWQLLSSARW